MVNGSILAFIRKNLYELTDIGYTWACNNNTLDNQQEFY